MQKKIGGKKRTTEEKERRITNIYITQCARHASKPFTCKKECNPHNSVSICVRMNIDICQTVATFASFNIAFFYN